MKKAVGMSALLDRLGKVGAEGTLKMTSMFEDSFLLNNLSESPTSIYALNIAMSGRLDGGLISGLTVVAGPSKHFKSFYSLIMASAYLKKHPEAVMLFYDSEFGSSAAYFESAGIDVSRVIHIPFTELEDLRADLAAKLSSKDPNAIQRGDKVVIFVDSIGNVASAKEVRDAENEHAAADMTRAKVMKSLFRIVTPKLRILDVPLIAVNHTYQTQEMYSKAVVSGGTGVMYSANDVWIIGKSQIKDETGLSGFTFTINIEKSRRVKEKSKIPVHVKFNGGISKYTGLMDIALAVGAVTKPKVGRFTRILRDEDGVLIPDKNWLYKEILAEEDEFYRGLFEQTDFKKLVQEKYVLSTGRLVNDEEIPEDADYDPVDLEESVKPTSLDVDSETDHLTN